ncbi:MAG TPA: TatD family hydrolase [Flavitalea sp.]|nr:TatD family hydrolase [Flavitalea sp.]
MSVQLIDTHCHLYLSEFDSDRPAVADRAREAGVTTFFLPAVDSTTHPALFQMERLDPVSFRIMMGLHPCSVMDNYGDELVIVRELVEKRSFAAIGEIGLDYYWDRSHDTEQQDAFEQQCALALEKSLPVVIHSRESLGDCIKLIRPFAKQGLKGIFHCFSGKPEEAEIITDMGFYLGIGGVITYKNSGLAEVVKAVPLENLVLETDAPYLAPVPFRGKRNESSYLPEIARKLAVTKGITLEEVASTTTANAQKIFGL